MRTHNHRFRSRSSTNRISRFLCGAMLVDLLVLTACAHAQPVGSRREPVAPHLRAPGTEAVRLPDPATTSEVGLDGILAFADARSPILKVARSTRSRAEAAKIAAEILLPSNPELGFGIGPRVARGGTGTDVELSLSQQIQIAGERGLRIDAADRLRELTDAEIEQIRWAVHTDVHAAFHRALVARERARLAERVLAFQEELLRVVERQIAAGDAAPLTLRLAQAEAAQARQASVAAAQSLLSARIRLAQLSGWPVDSPPVPIGGLDAPRDPPAQADLVRTARQHLPRLRVRHASVREAQARADLASREAWPRPSLGVAYRHEGNPEPEGPRDVVLGTITIPIPSWQLNQGERARTRADVTVAQTELDAVEMLLAGDIAQARSEVAAAAQRVRSYGTEVLPRFEENLTLLRRSFELGEIDLLALSIGRERFLRIQSDALDAHLDYFVAIADLERVIGVDLWRDEHHEEAP